MVVTQGPFWERLRMESEREKGFSKPCQSHSFLLESWGFLSKETYPQKTLFSLSFFLPHFFQKTRKPRLVPISSEARFLVKPPRINLKSTKMLALTLFACYNYLGILKPQSYFCSTVNFFLPGVKLRELCVLVRRFKTILVL